MEEGIDPGERLALLLTGMLWLSSSAQQIEKAERQESWTSLDTRLKEEEKNCDGEEKSKR